MEEIRNDFAGFQRLVAEQPALFARLENELNADAFAARTVQLAGELGYRFEPADVHRALAAARHAWLTRNLD